MMEQLEVKGLVIKSTPLGDYDLLLTVLTDTHGKMLISAKGAKSQKSKHIAATQLFCYSRFYLKRSHKYFYIADSELINSFYDLRTDLHMLSLATYCCDIANEFSMEESQDEVLLRLTLNALYAITTGKYDLSIVKAAYEFRVAVEEGYGPDLSSCARCGRDAADKYYLDVMNGQLFCGQCRHHEEKSSEGSNDGTARIYLPIYPSALQALRYLESCDISRFLLFRLEKEEIPLFRNVCENYLLHHVEHSFESLVYLKSII